MNIPLMKKDDPLVKSAEAILAAMQNACVEAYQSAYPVCCGRPGSECCGSPEPEWSPLAQEMGATLSEAIGKLENAIKAFVEQDQEGQ